MLVYCCGMFVLIKYCQFVSLGLLMLVITWWWRKKKKKKAEQINSFITSLWADNTS